MTGFYDERAEYLQALTGPDAWEDDGPDADQPDTPRTVPDPELLAAVVALQGGAR